MDLTILPFYHKRASRTIWRGIRKNTWKYITFSVPIDKEVLKIDKSGKEIIKTKSYKLQFIKSTTFIASSSLVNNLPDRIHTIECKHGHSDKKCDTFRIKYENCKCFLKYTNAKDNLIECKYLCCKKNYQKKFDETFKK